HNATSNEKTNYASVWHHGEIDWSEPDIDVARYVAHSLFRHMRTDAALTSYLLSDQLMYSSGFGVLRQTNVPAILLESSFYTNYEEEERLRDAHYNLREAYAIYEALCEYAYGGRPTQSLPEIVIEGETVKLRCNIDDGMPKNWWGSNRSRTVHSTIHLFFEDQSIPVAYDSETKSIEAILPLSASEIAEKETGFSVRIHHANQAKHHNWPQRYQIHLSRKAGGDLDSRIDVLGARRAGREPEILAQAEKRGEKSELTESEEAPKPEPKLLSDETIAKLSGAQPGDVLPLDDRLVRELPVLDARISVEPGPQLVFSDAPEYFHTGDGIAMEEIVAPGPIRLYVYHVPERSAGPKTITALLENRGDQPLTIRFHRSSFPKPGGHYHKIGKTGLLDFFGKKPGPDPRTVAPGEWIAIDPEMDATIVRDGDLVHGFYEFEIDQSARIVTLQRDPEMENSVAVEELPRLPQRFADGRGSGAGRGLFPISNFLVTRAAEAPVDTAEGPIRLVLSDGRSDSWIVGRDTISGEPSENRGNYGTIYRIRLKRSSSDGRSHALFMHNPFGATGPCSSLASAVEVRVPGREPEVVPVPRETVSFKGGGQAVLLQMLPPPENEMEIVEILFSPPGASCLPNPILLLPVDTKD
ncbi:MAG TPA: N-acetylmuramoyl-L-alanine amidase, partial [Opitutales bacterium]|nr:N-acetylmuramoyl-L-alanine amidase [Opitutales bacterium]